MNNLFGIEKISVGDCQELTIQSINAYAKALTKGIKMEQYQ